MSVHLTLNGIKESCPAPGEGVLDCEAASLTYTFENGYIVVLSGPLQAHILLVPNNSPTSPPQPAQSPPGPGHKLKFSCIDFSSKLVTKSIDLNAIKPGRGLWGSGAPFPPPMPSLDMGSPMGMPLMNGFRTGTPGQDGRNSSGSGVSSSPTMANTISSGGSTVGPAGPDRMVILERALIPVDPVNGFGITESTMRVLEVGTALGCRWTFVDHSF